MIDQQYDVGSEVSFDMNDEKIGSDAGVYTVLSIQRSDLNVASGLDCNLLIALPHLSFQLRRGNFHGSLLRLKVFTS